MGISRRDFVRSTALAAGALVSSKAQFAQTPASAAPPIRLGLASYTFRNFSRTQLISLMKQLNVFELNAKDVKDHLPSDLQAEQAALSDYAAAEIKVHAAGAIYFPNNSDADIRSKFEYCKRAGIKVMVVGDPAADLLSSLETLAKEYDLRIAIHNHGPEDKLWPSPLDILKVVKNMDPRMGCCIDVGHAARAGTDVVKAIHEVGPRLFNVHMKDLTNFQSKESQVAVGEGIIPVKGIFQALVATKYQGFVDLEYEVHPDDPMPGVIASFAYMRGVLTGMAA